MASEHEELERGQLATEVLQNRVYQESMAQLQTEILSRWQLEVDQEKREWLWSLNRSCKRLEQVLSETMQTGKLRQEQIKRDRSKLERLGDKLRRS